MATGVFFSIVKGSNRFTVNPSISIYTEEMKFTSRDRTRAFSFASAPLRCHAAMRLLGIFVAARNRLDCAIQTNAVPSFRIYYDQIFSDAKPLARARAHEPPTVFSAFVSIIIVFVSATTKSALKSSFSMLDATCARRGRTGKNPPVKYVISFSRFRE